MAATGEPYSVAARALAAADPDPAAPAEAESVEAESVAAAPPGAGPAADQAPALAEVIACAGRTLAASSARIQIQTDTDLGHDQDQAPRRRPGPIGRLAGRAARAAWGRVAPEVTPAEFREMLLHQFGAGFVEPAAGRYQIDWGGWAQLITDGRGFSGASGAPLGPRYENRPGRPRRGDPLDALRQLQGATAAAWAGQEQVRWTTCRMVTTTAGQEEFTVWIDDQRIRRFRTVQRGSGRSARTTRTETVELWDFGVQVDELDWTRLPAFRTPAGGGDVGSPAHEGRP